MKALTWESAGTDEPGDQNADTHCVDHGYWSLGPAHEHAADATWAIELIEQDEQLDELLDGGVHLGRFPTEREAKAAAQTYEDSHSKCLVLDDGRVYQGRHMLDDDGQPKIDMATCGHCGFTWNDALMTELTPAPSARCPNEYNHVHDEPEDHGESFHVEIHGEYGVNDGSIHLFNGDDEVVMWDSQEWIEDPSLVYVIAHAIRVGFEQGYLNVPDPNMHLN